jgi:methyl-accepting chemotaxis protein
MFSNLKIGVRLAAGFAAVLLALAAIWALSAVNIEQAGSATASASDRHEKTTALSRAQSAVWALRWDVAQFVAVPDDATRKKIVERAAPTRKQFEEAVAIYDKSTGSTHTTEEMAVVVELNSAFKNYSDARLHWFELLSSGKSEEAVAFRAQVLTPNGAETVAALGKLIELQGKLVADGEAAAMAQLHLSKVVLHAAGVAALALAALLAWALSRSITRPLSDAVEAVQTVARGDLTREIRTDGRDEVGQLLAALAAMQDNLRKLVGKVVGSAQAVSDSSAQIAQGNLDLSQRTEEQASTLEETAGSMEELTSTVNQNADNARQASQLAVGASEIAARGGQVVGEVVSTMTGISDSSRKIADIIGVIDGIAFQTNILALNAAVEAARAGEQGRGFAVVATEVRNLAQRSAGAAKEIKALIGDSVHKVEAGTRLVDAAGQTMQEIVGSVQKVSALIAEIAAASQEQSAGIGQVTAAVTQLEQVVQHNASLVEEATAATESMKAQAVGLLRAVGQFNIGEAHALRAAEPAPAPLTTVTAPGPIRYVPSPRLPGESLAAPRGSKMSQGQWQQF